MCYLVGVIQYVCNTMRLNIAWDVLSYKISQTRAKVARSGVEMLVSLWNSIGACCWGACQISKQLENSNQVFLFSSYYILGQSCWFSVTTALLRKLYRMASHCIVLFRVQFVFNSYWFATRMQCEFQPCWFVREGSYSWWQCEQGKSYVSKLTFTQISTILDTRTSWTGD